jgi:hypothetical protein
MGSQCEPPFGQVLGPGRAAPGELLDLPDAVTQRLLADVQFRGGRLLNGLIYIALACELVAPPASGSPC